MSDPIERVVDALTGCCSHCDDMAWGKADDLHAAGLLVSEQEAQERDRAAEATALLKAADALNAGFQEWKDVRLIEWLRGRADRLAQQGHEQEGQR